MMKVIFITQNDPFYTRYFFEEYIKLFPQIDYELKGVFFFSPMNDSLKKLISRTWNFYGPVGFLKMGIKYVFTKVLERLGRNVTAYNLLRSKGINVSEIKDANSEEFLNWIKKEQIDLIVSVSAPQIFKGKLLSAPKIGCINIHTGKIPSYRGLFPNFWQMLNNEKYSTITIHEMAKEIDKGNIIKEKAVEIKPEYSLTDLIIETKKQAPALLNEVIEMYKHNKVKLFENSNLKPGYYKFPGSEDVKLFKQKGMRIL